MTMSSAPASTGKWIKPMTRIISFIWGTTGILMYANGASDYHNGMLHGWWELYWIATMSLGALFAAALIIGALWKTIRWAAR